MKPIKVEDIFRVPMRLFFIIAVAASDLVLVLTKLVVDILKVVILDILGPINRGAVSLGDSIIAQEQKLGASE